MSPRRKRSDTHQKQQNLYEFYALGLDRLFPISAEHGLGVTELMDEIVQCFPDESEADATEPAEAALCIAIVGRPNVGKSTLFNRLIGQRKAIVEDLLGLRVDLQLAAAEPVADVGVVDQ